MILDTERRAGLYVITSGTRLGWLVVGRLGLSVSLRVTVWTRWISLLRKERLYPRSLRYWMSSLARNVKLSSEEHMRRNRRARLNGMARLVCRG